MSLIISSIDSPKPLLIRVKRRADEEKNVPNKRFKFVATSDSPNDDHIHELVSKTCPTLPSVSRPEDKLKIQDYEEWSVRQNKTKEVITCNGQPLVSAQNNKTDSLDYLYDIYVYDDDQDLDNPSQYRECEDSEEDPDDENYAYNDYPDEDEVSDEVIDYYEYRDDQNDSQKDLSHQFSRHNITRDSDYDLSDEDIDELQKYSKGRGYLAESDSDSDEKELRSEDKIDD